MEKIVTQGNFQLKHSRYINDFGFETDSFAIFDVVNRVNYPFHAPLKMHTKTDYPINKIPYEYTDEDYKNILIDTLKKLRLK